MLLAAGTATAGVATRSVEDMMAYAGREEAVAEKDMFEARELRKPMYHFCFAWCCNFNVGVLV